MADLGPVTVTAGDVAELWRPFSTTETAIAARLLSRAVAILPVKSPGLLDRLDTEETPPEAVEQVLIQAVLRIMHALVDNPDGWRKGARSGDDYSESWEYDEAMILAGLYFTEQELATLRPGDAVSRRRKAFVINQMPA